MARNFRSAWVAAFLVCSALYSHAADVHKQAITAYVVPVAEVTDRVPATAVVHLAIALTPRDEDGLRALATAVSDPKSSQFRHFLTLAQLTERFSPTAADYQALIAWAEANHLTVEGQYPHRMTLLVKGNASDVESALAVKLGHAKRPDGTTFYKPDRAPSIDLDVKIAHIAGLDNLFVPRHHGGGGSQVDGSFGSADLRNAYATKCLGLTGAGESVGIMSYAAYDPTDIATYETTVGISNTSACGSSTPGSAPCLTNVPVPSTYTETATAETAETTADVELAIAMAPGLHQVKVFQADATTGCSAGDGIVSAWLAATDTKQFSSSVSFCESDVFPTIEMMAAAGQSVFASSGDYGTGYNGNFNNFSIFLQGMITPVGGTDLTMTGSGKTYGSELAWAFSGGGIESLPGNPSTCPVGCTPNTPGCSNNCMPQYQKGVANAQNGASSTYRNDPDIAMPSMRAFTVIGGNKSYFCGTSASSPLMAGFLALANQQRCTNASADCAQGLGFVSPDLYAIGLNTQTLATSFNDIIGNSTDTLTCGGGGTSAPAVKGYDLATGWGTPTCGLIDQLSCTTCSGTVASKGTSPSTSCVSFQSDSNNCGTCGNVCSALDRCVQGSCVLASTIGDTHITTFDGLYYDFQASGEFILAQEGSNFVVQTRQASGAPTWPLAAVNKSVATKMGKTSVSLCIEPTRLFVNNQPRILDDGKSLSLPDDVRLTRSGDVYTVANQAGETVQATLNSTWINVSVGLGHSLHGPVRGLLGNANGTPADDIAPRDRTAFAQPVLFDDLYRQYGESWRVPAGESMLCGDDKNEYIIPQKPFYAADLDPREFERAQTVCTAAGVTNKTLLEACTLDTAVLADKTAARVFVHAARPIVIMHPVLHLDPIKPLPYVPPNVVKPPTP
jgi:hypothetical protein